MKMKKMTLAEKLQKAGLSYDVLLDSYRDVFVQTGLRKEAADHIFWRSDEWNGDETFTLPELIAGLEKEA